MSRRERAYEILRNTIKAGLLRLPTTPDPVSGWVPGHYVCTMDPMKSLLHDCCTGRWAVWSGVMKLSEGATREEAIARIPAHYL